jgi:serine/threonine protein kinase, bacterial
VDEVVFGRYRLLSVIGEGGMGKVYKAHDTMMDRDVAIKVLPPELATEPGYEQRFRREAHTAARLTAPHIIPIYESGELDGRLYLVMPIIEGIDIGGLLRRDGPMSPQRAVRVIEQLSGALDAAHAVGLVHRDVKPSNALITGRDFVYLIDFGIAHDAAATKLTSTGMIVGTLSYMAPERFTAGIADARSDVYALACVLHECLTGRPPYPGESMEQQIAGHLTLDPPKPSARRPELPLGFDEVIATGMAKDPEKRYQSAHELAIAAQHALATAPSHNPHAASTLDATEPAPTPLDDQVPPRHASASEPVRQRAADHNFAATPQPAPGRPPAPQSRPADRPVPRRVPTMHPQRRTVLIATMVVIVVLSAAAFVTFRLLQPHPPAPQTQTAPPATPSTTASETSTAPVPGAKYTIANYITENHITETPIHKGDPGAPTIGLAIPPGWQVADDSGASYGTLVLAQPANPSDPPNISALVSKLTGDVDPAKIIQYAPGELQNLPGYEGSGDGSASTLSGFQAWQISGYYSREGRKRAVAQKTVVIPSQGAIFVLQLNADSLDSDQGPLMDATNVVDERTTITP